MVDYEEDINKLRKQLKELTQQLNTVATRTNRVHKEVTHPSVIGRVTSHLGKLSGRDNEIEVTGGDKSIFAKAGVELGLPQGLAIISLGYGSMYANNVTQAVAFGAVDTYVQVGASMTGGLCNGFTFQNNRELLCNTAGKYLVTWFLSLQTAAAANIELEGAVMIDSSPQPNGTAHTEVSLGAINRPQTLGGTGIYTFAAANVLSLAVANHTDTTSAIVVHASLSAIRVGA